MAFAAGYNTVISLDSSAGSPTDISAYCDSVSGFDLASVSQDVTTFSNTAQKFILLLEQSPVVTIGGPWDATHHSFMLLARATKTDKTFKVSFAGGGTGTPYVSAEVLITNYATATTASGNVTWTAQLQVNGATSTGTN